MFLNLVSPNDPILRKPTRPVLPEEINHFSDIISTMFSILDATNGIGLSAPQIGLDRSIFVISIDGQRKTFINPAILAVSENTITEQEGCLSIPGLTLKVTRPEKVTASWLNEDNVAQIADLEALWARCWLHEYDHLQGIMIDDRVSKLALDIARRKLAKRNKLNKKG